MDWMPQAIREGIFTIIFISGPLVVLAAVLGLSVGIIQAATQIQEQTLGSAVKIIGLFLALIVFGFYMFQYLRQYTIQNMERAFKLVPSLGNYVKPRQNFLSVKEDDIDQRSGVNIPGLNAPEPIPSNSSAKAQDLTGPDIANINEGAGNSQTLGLPKGQEKNPNENIKKIEDAFQVNEPGQNPTPAPTRAPTPAPAPQRTAPKPQATTPQRSSQPITPTRTNPVEPVVKPKPRKRKSLTNALDRIRSSIDEFNETNTQGAQ